MPRRTAQSPAAAVNALSAFWWRITWLARLAIVLLVSGPILGSILALFGQNELGAVVALTPFVGAILWLAAFRKPQNVVAIAPLVGLAAVSGNRREIFRTVVRWVALYLAAVAAVSIYLYLVPVSRSPWLALPLIATVLLLLLLSAGRALGGMTKFLLVSLIVGITAAFFFGGRIKEETAEAAAQAGAGVSQTVPEGREIARIPLLGEGKPSDKFLGPRMVPAGWDYFFEGPPEAKVHFDDGTVGPITKWYGLKGGVRRFSGPEGKEVIVRAYPPG